MVFIPFHGTFHLFKMSNRSNEYIYTIYSYQSKENQKILFMSFGFDFGSLSKCLVCRHKCLSDSISFHEFMEMKMIVTLCLAVHILTLVCTDTN